MQSPDLCAYHRCSRELGEERSTLPEDGRDPSSRPQFCSTSCAALERFKRKYDRKIANEFAA